jgi:hypothetical protein
MLEIAIDTLALLLSARLNAVNFFGRVGREPSYVTRV